MGNTLKIKDRTFVILRKAGRASAAQFSYHAVAPNVRAALCGAEPGSASRWAEPPAEAVTCQACLKRLRRLGA